jgi:hypothetical protein
VWTCDARCRLPALDAVPEPAADLLLLAQALLIQIEEERKRWQSEREEMLEEMAEEVGFVAPPSPQLIFLICSCAARDRRPNVDGCFSNRTLSEKSTNRSASSSSTKLKP